MQSRPLAAASPFRKGRLEDINRRYEAVMAGGYPVTLEGVAETLQVARDVDRTNWLTVYTICQEGATAGLGDEPGQMFLQATSNRQYVMTFNEALSIIRDLRAWTLAVWANWNRLKAAARDPEVTRTAADLEALDLDEGWP